MAGHSHWAKIKRAKGAIDGGRTPAGGGSLLKHRHLVASLDQGAGAGNACHACANDGEVARAGRRVGPVDEGERLDALGGGDDVALHGALPFSSMMVFAMTAS